MITAHMKSSEIGGKEGILFTHQLRMQIHPGTDDSGMPQPVPPGWLNNGSWALSSPILMEGHRFLQKWARKDLTKDHISANETQLCGQEWPGGFVTSPPWAPAFPPPWAGVTHRNGQLLDLKLQGWSWGSHPVWKLRPGDSWFPSNLGASEVYFSYIQESISKERKEGSYGGNCTWDAWAHCVLMTSGGFPEENATCSCELSPVSSTTSLWSSSPFHKTERSAAELLLFRYGLLEPPVYSPTLVTGSSVSPPEAGTGSCSGRLWAAGWWRSPLYGLPHSA